MWGRSTRIMLVAVLLTAGCSKGSDSGAPAEPTGVAFTKVDLPNGSGVPVELAKAGNILLIGTRRDGQPLVPGLFQRGPDARVSEIPSQGSTPYGLISRWFSIVSDGKQIFGIGGETGGAHGNFRWSVWTGGLTGITEKAQAFTTFSGYGSGELTDIVLTPSGPAILGTWQSAKAGYDVASWLPTGDDWNRQESAGTALESTLDGLGFPVAATSLQQGVLVVGWALTGKPGTGPTPYIWESKEAVTGWTKAELPDAGHDGAALSVACWDSVCEAAGRVDGKLAAWQRTGGSWARVGGEPPVPVTDKDHLANPLRQEGKMIVLVSEGGQVKIARADDAGKWTVRKAVGPTGTVIATAVVDGKVYVVADQTLWQVDAGALSR